MRRFIVASGVALVCGLTSCRAHPCPPAAGAPPTRVAGVEPPQVFVEMTCVRIPDADAAALPAGAASSSTVFLDAAERDALLAEWRRNTGIEIVIAPRILALAEQRATVFVGEDLTPAAGPAGAAPLHVVAPEDDPNRAWIGTSILVTPTVGSGAVELDLDARWSEAQHPDAMDVAGLDIRRASAARRIRVTPEQTALVVADGALERGGRAYRMAYLVGARVLPPEATR